MISAYVKGFGCWIGSEHPPCKVVESRLGRGTSHVTRMAVECVERAALAARFDLAEIGSVFGSALGELEIAIEQLEMMLSEEGIVSPARFKNSVHNTATGVLSIATKNRNFTTAIAAGDHTVPVTLLEAMLVLETGLVKQAIAVVADDTPPEPIRSVRADARYEQAAGLRCVRSNAQSALRWGYGALGVAFALDRSPDGALARITLAQNVDGEPLSILEEMALNPCAPALGLIGALESRRSGTYVLSSPPLGQGWSVRLECLG